MLAICLPWLTPTRDVISAVLSDHCKAGHLHSVLGEGHAEPAIAAFEAAYRVLSEHRLRDLTLLPPSCGFITHDEVRLLSLCCAAQMHGGASARRQASGFVGPVWSPFLFASLERLTCVLSQRSLWLSFTATALRRTFH